MREEYTLDCSQSKVFLVNVNFCLQFVRTTLFHDSSIHLAVSA